MAITILLADGVTPNDTDHRFVATSLDGTLEGFIVASADHYSDDATFTMPTEWQVSFASPWTTWYGAAEAPAACPEFGDVPYPVRFRQHSYGTTDSNTFSTAGTDTACTALGTITDLVATPGNGQVTLTWTDVANASSYLIEWGTTTGYGSTISDAGSPYVHTGRTNGTELFYRIHAVGEGRFSDGGTDTASATPALIVNFAAGESLPAWLDDQTAGGGTVTVASNKCALSQTTAATDAAALVFTTGVDKTASWTYRVKARALNTGAGTDAWDLLALAIRYPEGGQPIAGTNTSYDWTMRIAVRIQLLSGVAKMRIMYRHTDNMMYWTGAAWTATEADAYLTAAFNTDYNVRFYHTSTQFWFTVSNAADDTVIYDTSGSKINWTSLVNNATEAPYVVIGDGITDLYKTSGEVVYVSKVAG